MPVAIEVKSADNTKSKSLNALLENKNWKVTRAIRLSAKNTGGTSNIDSYPLYMSIFL